VAGAEDEWPKAVLPRRGDVVLTQQLLVVALVHQKQRQARFHGHPAVDRLWNGRGRKGLREGGRRSPGVRRQLTPTYPSCSRAAPIEWSREPSPTTTGTGSLHPFARRPPQARFRLRPLLLEMPCPAWSPSICCSPPRSPRPCPSPRAGARSTRAFLPAT